VIATPATMVALLQAVGLAWREATLSERAERVRELAVELCRRMAKFADHLSNSGNGIERATRAHNEAVGSFEGRILPTARRMAELGVADGATIETPARLETQVRPSANGNGSQPELDQLAARSALQRAPDCVHAVAASGPVTHLRCLRIRRSVPQAGECPLGVPRRGRRQVRASAAAVLHCPSS
jgi:hypothetical protein